MLGIRGNDALTHGSEADGAFGQSSLGAAQGWGFYRDDGDDEHRDRGADGQGADDICGCGDATCDDASGGSQTNHQPAMHAHHTTSEVIRRGCLQQGVGGDEEENHAEADTDDEPSSDSHAATVGQHQGAKPPAEGGPEEEVAFVLDAAGERGEEESCGECANPAHRHERAVSTCICVQAKLCQRGEENPVAGHEEGAAGEEGDEGDASPVGFEVACDLFEL